MRIIGEAQQQWAPLRRRYNLYLYHAAANPETDLGTRQIASGDLPLSKSQQVQVASQSGTDDVGEYNQFAYVDEPFLSWDFSLLSADKRLIGSVNRNFAGFGREIFTDTGVYALRMDAAALTNEPRHMISQTGQKHQPAYDEKKFGMTLDQRAVMLATAVSVDFDYFSRTRGGMGFMPMWFPMGGGAAEGAAAGEAAGAAGAAGGAAGGVMEGGAGAVGNVARGATGIGEGAAVGAGSVAGYEAMQRGLYGGDGAAQQQQQAPPQDYGAGQARPEDNSPLGEEEELWGEDSNPWGGGGGGGRGADGGEQGGGGEGGGGGGGWTDIDEWFS